MLLTNALLSLSISLSSNFVAILKLPPAAGPSSIADIQRFNLGFYYSPTDVYIQLQNSNQFWIRHGVVQRFLSADSNIDNPRHKATVYTNIALLSSNDAFGIARHLVAKLVRNGDPTVGVSPNVVVGSDFTTDGAPASYLFSWPSSDASFRYSASLEVDVRRGTVTYVDLRNPAFFDFAHALEISNRVIVPEASTVIRNPKTLRPTLAQIEAGLTSLAELCRRLDVRETFGEPRDVDFANSFCVTNPPYSISKPMCSVTFSNGAGFHSMGGTVFSFAAHDICFGGHWGNRPRQYFNKFNGKVNYKWEDLAGALESKLIRRLNLPKKRVESLVVTQPVHTADLGDIGLNRTLLQWNESQASGEAGSALLVAEFDLGSGDLKLLTFFDPVMCKTLQRVIGKAGAQ